MWRVEDIRALLKQISAGETDPKTQPPKAKPSKPAAGTGAPVSAGPLVFIDPDRHPNPWGADLTTYFYGVKLLTPVTCDFGPGTYISGIEQHEGYGDVGTPNIATAGKYVFGEFWCTGYGDGYSTEYYEDRFILQFTRRAYSVQADLIFDHVQDPRAGRRGVLKAYDSCGRLLQAVYVNGGARAPVDDRQAGVYFATTASIARVTIGGADGGFVAVDNIQVHL